MKETTTLNQIPKGWIWVNKAAIITDDIIFIYKIQNNQQTHF